MGVSQSLLSRLQLVQNAAARLLTGTRKREHISPVLISLHWLPVKYRIHFKSLLFVYKGLHGLAPSYISDLLFYCNASRELRSNSSLQLTVPRTRLKLKGDRAFSVAAPQLWNNLPSYIRSAPTYADFKSLLKTYYLLLHMVSSKHSGAIVVYYLLLCFVYSCILVYVLFLYSTLANSCCF